MWSDTGGEGWPGEGDTGVDVTLLLATSAARPALAPETSADGEDSGTVGLEGKSVL